MLDWEVRRKVNHSSEKALVSLIYGKMPVEKAQSMQKRQFLLVANWLPYATLGSTSIFSVSNA